MRGWRVVLAIAIISICLVIAFRVSRNTGDTGDLEPEPQAAGAYTVYFLDVGQGDAELIDYGTNELLIDTGPGGSGVVDKIRPYIDGHLELVVITHPHADHDGSLTAVQSAYAVDRTVTSAAVGDVFALGGLSFVTRNAPWGSADVNEDSLVLTLRTPGASFWFAGDAGKPSEARMLSAGLVQQTAILKVGHHGSTTASGTTFLSVLQPEVAIYSAGAGNSYGLPKPETLTALHAAGANVYGTDTNGTVAVTVTDSGYTVRTERG